MKRAVILLNLIQALLCSLYPLLLFCLRDPVCAAATGVKTSLSTSTLAVECHHFHSMNSLHLPRLSSVRVWFQVDVRPKETEVIWGKVVSEEGELRQLELNWVFSLWILAAK